MFALHGRCQCLLYTDDVSKNPFRGIKLEKDDSKIERMYEYEEYVLKNVLLYSI